MKYFIGIVPPEDIYETIENIQKQYGDNRLEPHITVRPPVTLLDQSAWLRAIEQVCASFAPITISLPWTGNFGKRVLFIDVVSPSLHALHADLISAIEPFEVADNKLYVDDSFHPHLTLGRAWCGFSQDDFAAIRKLADSYLSASPIMFKAAFLRVYKKAAHVKRYETVADVPLQLPIASQPAC
jgi:2'-5' RNA ligase